MEGLDLIESTMPAQVQSNLREEMVLTRGGMVDTKKNYYV